MGCRTHESKKEMSINNTEYNGTVGEPSALYEEFEDILDFETSPNATSRDALLPNNTIDIKTAITEEKLQHDIERVEKLRPEEVRWFYKSGKKKKWTAFIGSDSIAIEAEWRCVSISKSEIKRVCVRGGMYEVDVLERKCYPVYWSSFNSNGDEDSAEITRGTWFYDGTFTPLEETTANRIEFEHIERWKDCTLEEVRYLIGNTVMHSMKLSHCHVDWYSVNDVYIHSDTVSYRALRNIVQRFGASKTSTSGHRLHRGYREDAMHEDCMPAVKHLVFVVHGIGAKPDRHKIVRNTNEFRIACERVVAKHFTHYIERVEFLPVEWRSKLALDDTLVDTLTPKKGQGVRQFLNNNLMDIMYYTSLRYRGEIVQALRNEISRLHYMFIERNPEFSGKISIFAHSLGSVIMHDIMTCWGPETLLEEYIGKDSKFENSKMAQLAAHTSPQMRRQTGLGFTVENFFCVGSPLAIFLHLRGQSPTNGKGTQEDIVPVNVCNRIFNIFHPADPIAYRFEPLILSHYVNIAPLQIHWHNALHKTPYNEMLPKPYQFDSARKKATVPDKDSSVDLDIPSTDNSDVDELSLKDEWKEEKASPRQNTGAVSSDDNPRKFQGLQRRTSYLHALSGGAYRVGKALLSKARGTSPSDPKQIVSADHTKEQEPSETISDDSLDDRVESRASSGSCSPVQNLEQDVTTSPRSPTLKNGSNEPISFESISGSSVQLAHRLDYELQEGFTESRLGYASITSHTSYWGNQDVAFFVLMQIHPEATMAQSLRS